MTERINIGLFNGMVGMSLKGREIHMPTDIKPGIRRYFSKIGRKGGLVKSETKAQAVRKNGLKGGRPTQHELKTIRMFQKNGNVKGLKRFLRKIK